MAKCSTENFYLKAAQSEQQQMKSEQQNCDT